MFMTISPSRRVTLKWFFAYLASSNKKIWHWVQLYVWPFTKKYIFTPFGLKLLRKVKFWHFLKFFWKFWKFLASFGAKEEVGINMSISKYHKCMQKYPKSTGGGLKPYALRHRWIFNKRIRRVIYNVGFPDISWVKSGRNDFLISVSWMKIPTITVSKWLSSVLSWFGPRVRS